MKLIIETNDLKKKLQECYKKFKSYVYYSPTLAYLKQRIAEFEDDLSQFENTFTTLAKAIIECNSTYLNELIDKIDFLAIPKPTSNSDNKMKSQNIVENKNINITNTRSNEKVYVVDINCFIDGPIEIFILDIFLTLNIGKIAENNTSYKKYCYANRLHRDTLEENGNIKYGPLPLFKFYFSQYKHWKNDAIEKSEEIYKSGNDSTMVTLDISGYYYNVDANIKSILRNINIDAYDSPSSLLVNFFQELFLSFTKKIINIKQGVHLASILPIGLTTSSLLANIYLLPFDETCSYNCEYYGRYVDDIIFVIKKKCFNSFQKLVENYNLPFICKDNNFILNKFPSLIVKNDKLRIISIHKKGSKELLDKLRTKAFNISEHNLFPNFNADIEELMNDVYKNQDYLRIRDIDSISIDSSKIAKTASGLLTSLLGTKQNIQKFSKKNESIYVKKAKCLYNTLNNTDLINIIFKWESLILLFFSLEKKYLHKINTAIKQSINSIHYAKSKKGMVRENNELIKKSCKKYFENASFSLMAATADYTILEDTNNVTAKYRQSNMFNKQLVQFPLSNFASKIEDNLNFNILKFEPYIDSLNKPLNQFKLDYSPYHIGYNEYLFAFELYYLVQNKNYDVNKILNDYFDSYGLKHGIEKPQMTMNNVTTANINNLEYTLNKITLPKSILNTNNRINLGSIKMAIAVYNLESLSMIQKKKRTKKYVLNTRPYSQHKKNEIISVLNDAYCESFQQNIHNIKKANRVKNNAKEINNEQNNHSDKESVDYVIFPELFLPVEWFQLVDKFSRETQSIITTGLRYVVYKKKAYNFVLVDIPFYDCHYHKQSCVFIRKKNAIPLYEDIIINDSNLKIEKTNKNNYFVFEKDGVSFAPLICFEATDVMARSILKNNIDFAFTIAYNKDTKYFNSIGRSTARDLFCYYIECNSSNLGSTSYGPLKNKFLPLVSNKGDQRNHMQIVKIDLESLRNYKKNYLSALELHKDFDKNKEDFDQKNKFKKPSANTK